MSTASQPSASPSPAWSGGLQHLFRFSFVFFGLLSLPLSPGYWRSVFGADWSRGHFQDFFRLAEWSPQFLPEAIVPEWGLASFAHLAVALIVALAAAGIWAVFAAQDANYDRLNYWLRVVVRYRLALALIGYGVIKLIPLQFPAPTLSDLHTPYGDFLLWKIYYLTTGVSSAGYQSMLGAFEIIAGLLLLDRRTATIGAGLAAAVLINIVLANFAYELGDHVYSVYLLLLAGFLLAHDTPRLYQLLVRERPARADRFEPGLSPGLRRWRTAGNALIALWAVGFGVAAYASYRADPGLFPTAPGVPETAGFYRVSKFSRDGVAHPPSSGDPARWRDVVFEPWNTLSIASPKPVTSENATPRIAALDSDQRNYEQAGNGGRVFYTYVFDEATHTLALTNKTNARDRYVLKLDRPAADRLELTGTGPAGETLAVSLERADKRYLLNEGRRRPVTIN